MQSFTFVDPTLTMHPLAIAGPSSKSPVFDFDDVWADHVLALRNTAKASLGDGSDDVAWPLLPMEGVSPTFGVRPEEYPHHQFPASHWTSAADASFAAAAAGAPVAHAQPVSYPQLQYHHHHHPQSDVDAWMMTANAPYGAMFPNTFEGYMMPIDQTSSTTSVSTLESPRSSRGSKRPPSTDDDDDEDYDMPLEFASSKAKRPRIDVNPTSTSSGSSCGVHIASAAPANNAVFILPNDKNVHATATGGEDGFWETVQGPWELSDIPPPPPSQRHAHLHHHHANAFAFFPVRAMPPLQVPVPRLPQQIWSAAAALGSN